FLDHRTASIPAHKRSEDLVRGVDVNAPELFQSRFGLSGINIAVPQVRVHASCQYFNVQFRVKLGGVHVASNPEHLDRTGARSRQDYRSFGHRGERFLVADVRLKLLRNSLQQWVTLAMRGKFDDRSGYRLAIGAVDGPTQLGAEHADAEACAEERKVGFEHFAYKPLQVCFDSLLFWALYRVGDVQRATAQN